MDCEETAEKEDVPSKDLSSRAQHTHRHPAARYYSGAPRIVDQQILGEPTSPHRETTAFVDNSRLVVIQSQRPFSFTPDSISSQSLLNM